MKAKKRNEKRVKEELHITPDRGYTWVGVRNTVFSTDKKNPKKDRRNAKLAIRKEW